jgi:hypothetical protein
MAMTNAAKSVSITTHVILKRLKFYHLDNSENSDACLTAAEIYNCGLQNQMVVTYNMTEVGEGNLAKVFILAYLIF